MAASYGKTIIHYDGTNVGAVYLKDIGQRNQLGGGRGIYVKGQDCYVDYGTDTTFISTSDVMLSATSGVIKAMVDASSFRLQIVDTTAG
jgi:hypothetical protein